MRSQRHATRIHHRHLSAGLCAHLPRQHPGIHEGGTHSKHDEKRPWLPKKALESITISIRLHIRNQCNAWQLMSAGVDNQQKQKDLRSFTVPETDLTKTQATPHGVAQCGEQKEHVSHTA